MNWSKYRPLEKLSMTNFIFYLCIYICDTNSCDRHTWPYITVVLVYGTPLYYTCFRHMHITHNNRSFFNSTRRPRRWHTVDLWKDWTRDKNVLICTHSTCNILCLSHVHVVHAYMYTCIYALHMNYMYMYLCFLNRKFATDLSTNCYVEVVSCHRT